MPRYQWASPDAIQQKVPVDLKAGANLSRRRFVELALFTSASVVLSNALPAAVKAAEVSEQEIPPNALRSPLLCSPAETAWDVPETRFDAVAVIEPEDLPRIDREFRPDAST